MPTDDAQERRTLADQIEGHFKAGHRYIVLEPHEIPTVIAALRATPDDREARVRAAEEMRLVIIESPYAGDVERNVAYAKAAVRDCLARGEAPYASHLFFTQPGVLDDTVPSDRSLGIEAGLAWGAMADATVVYGDLGVTTGMRQGIERAEKDGRVVEYRSISIPEAAPEEPLERVRHVRRGTEYEVLGEAAVQDASGLRSSHGSKVTFYRCVETGRLWCCFTDEFRDGRFETLPPPPSTLSTGPGGGDGR